MQERPAANAIADLGGETMGTTWRVRLSVPRTRALRPLHDGIQERLDAVVAQMSPWEPDSDISRYNRAAADTWHALPPEFLAVLQAAIEIAAASDGAFDPTLGALVDLWGFGPGGAHPRLPDPAALDAARPHCGWRRLELDASGTRLRQPGGLRLDLSAIAKGFGVDAVAADLREAGIDGALVEVGGELRGFGRRPDGEYWRVLVEAVADADEAPCVLPLDGCAVATSGDRWHRFEHDGRRYSHSIDPRSGAPVADAAAAVTVVAGDAMRADAWSTALTVLGPEDGFALAARHGLAARFAQRGSGGAISRATPAFERLLAE
ncbi:FAD:protein FMN transferase [Luteimonas sp. R10]|uniref:FAD:protein FMN transferase n=1 Tax=Luteimonas sp. R10 TaxID=3108176 RepID=UPI00308A4419|nr:FAD:protein FMN transferase [Luteimonas sp. R10]